MTLRISKRLITILVAAIALAWLVACQSQSGTTANRPPSAQFTATPGQGDVPLTVDFDASASADPDGTVTSYAWDFGDGAAGSGAIASHTYETAGTFTVTLTVTDDRSATDSAVATVTAGQTASIAGTITPGLSGATARGAQPVARHAPVWEPSDDLEFVPGEIIVKFAPTVGPHAASALDVAGVRLDAAVPLALPRTHLYRRAGLDRARTLEVARILNARPDVLYAQPNYILQPLLEPDDEFYSFQWHYPSINLPAAWDITTGSPDVVVAVGDTGILFDAVDAGRTHPDFAGKALPGYDFITDPLVAGDGDGRDPDAYDEGDNPGGQSSYHGTHVAGTVAAGTDNAAGVAGVDWEAKLLAVRMLGEGGGSIQDIVEGTLWAAGLSVAGVPDNPNPAHVVNLSLGGASPCTPFEQEAFDRIAAESPRQTIVVVAAGNDDQNASDYTPASCRNVITVGASEFRDQRAPYSNFGSRIDVMAPGGDLTADRNGDTFADGVLSTFFFDGAGGGFSYGFQHGTSMAAPHVAGAVSLMKALDPDLTLQDALSLLQATARPLTAEQCNRSNGSDCGAGLIDVAAALTALQSGEIPTPGGGSLAFSPNPLEFGSDADELDVTLTNTGDATLDWEILAFDPAPDNPGDMLDGSVFVAAGAPSSGTLAAGSSVTTTLGIDRSRVTAEGVYQFALLFDADGQEQALTVRFSTLTSVAPDLSGPMLVAAFLEETPEEYVLSGFEERDAFFSDYSFEVLPGENIVIAWSDENGNSEVDPGDYVGVYPEYVPLAAGDAATGIDFAIERVISVESVPDGPLRDAAFRRQLIERSARGGD